MANLECLFFISPEAAIGNQEQEAFAGLVEWVRIIEAGRGDLGLSSGPLPSVDAPIKWPNCGMTWAGDLVSAVGPEGPGRPTGGTMLDVVETGHVPAGYFLSENAATGMLRRADRMQRKFLPALRRALERLKGKAEAGAGRSPKGNK